MGTLFRLLKVVAVVLVVAVGALVLYVAFSWNRQYDLPLPAVQASTDPAVITQGEHLVYGPAHCAACHVASWDEAHRVRGGERLPLRGGLPFPLGPLGMIYSANLTPDPETGIGRYSDGQLARVLRHAVLPDGRATLGPLMPYGDMGDDDLTAVVSYLRAQAPVRHAVPARTFTLVGKVIKSFASATLPRFETHPPRTAPAQAATRERGQYLAASVANCVGCHTPRDPGTFEATGPEYSGGFEMEPEPGPGVNLKAWFRTPNLTPAPGSALSTFPDRAAFVDRLLHVGRRHEGSPMPWELYANLSDTDASALYEFLRSLPPSPGPTGYPAFVKED